MKKTHLLVLALVAGAVVLAVGAVSAYASITSDQAKPVTTTNVGSDPYWDTAAITVTATDNEGVAYIYHKLDGHVVRLDPIGGLLTTDLTVPTAKDAELAPDTLAPGEHTLTFWAQDVNGNVEAPQSVKFTLLKDTVPPTTSASSVSVRRNRTATLKYKVMDAAPTKGTATVTIKVKNSKGKTVRTIASGAQNVNVALTAKFRCTLAKGAYKYYVYATDASGNAQAKAGSAKLTVR